MSTNRTSVREARASISKIFGEGKTVAVGNAYELRGFIVGTPKHNNWNAEAKG